LFAKLYKFDLGECFKKKSIYVEDQFNKNNIGG